MEVVVHCSLDELKKLHRAEQDVQRARKLQIVILAMQGWTAPAVATAVGLTRRVVQSHVSAFNRLGLDSIDEQRGAPPQPLLTPEQTTAFETRVAQGPQPGDAVCSLRGRDYQRILKEEFGKVRGLTTIYRLLHRLGYAYLRPRPQHQRADPEKQAEFVRALPKRIAAVSTAHPGQKIRLYFEDEARFGQQGTVTELWAKRGSRPEQVRQTAYEYLWVLAAVCPETGASEGLLASKLNTDTINQFLQQLSQRLPADEHAILIWDGAGFHRGGKLQVPTNITTIQLPAYSPEFNPIENLWHYLRSHYWSNRSYENYEALEQAAVDAWQHCVLDTELMKTVCAATACQRAGI